MKYKLRAFFSGRNGIDDLGKVLLWVSLIVMLLSTLFGITFLYGAALALLCYTRKRQEITIQGSSNMSREEIDRAVREAQQYAAEDARARSDAQVKDRLESLLYHSEEARKNMDKEQKKQLDEAIKNAKRALRHRDTAAMTAAADALESLIGTQGNAGSGM